MKNILLFFFIPFFGFSQGYTSYFIGNTANVIPVTEFGICLMGGATEHDNAMKWLLQKANGGDIIVLRSSGSNGYNDYLYSQLGEVVNSVETIVITSVAGATNPYVLDKVSKAEMIWFAGGNQWNYVSFFKNNALEDLINLHINVKNAPIGGTSAGMAILASHYFSAQNGSVTSTQALSNPYSNLVTIGNDDFISTPLLQNIITDTHFDNPDRKGRLSSFLARLKTDYSARFFGMAANEYVAICIDLNGKARVFGDYPNYNEFAYFVQPNCNPNNSIDNCEPNRPLTWNFGGEALKVYKVPGTMNGTNYFKIDDWLANDGQGGSWENWSVNNGVLSTTVGVAPSCVLSISDYDNKKSLVFPNPFEDTFRIDLDYDTEVFIYDLFGIIIFNGNVSAGETIDCKEFSSGIYFLKTTNTSGSTTFQKIIKK